MLVQSSPIMYFEWYVNNTQIILMPFWIEMSFFKANEQSAMSWCPHLCSETLVTSAVKKPFKYCEIDIYVCMIQKPQRGYSNNFVSQFKDFG